MAFVIFILVVALNSLLFFLKKESKLIAGVSAVFLALLMAFSSVEIGSGDSYYYNLEYYNSDLLINSGETTFNFLMVLFNNLGFSFQWFRFVMFLFCFLLICFPALKNGKSINLFVVLYAISIYYFLCVSLNFFIGLSVVVFATSFLNKKRIIIFAALVLLASTIHQSMIFSLFLLITIFRKRNKQHKYFFLSILVFAEFLFLVAMTIFTSLIPHFTNFVYQTVEPFFNTNSSYLREYLTVGFSRSSALYALFYLLNLLLAKLAMNHISQSDDYSSNQKSFCDFSYLISLLCSFFIPFLIITPTMTRMLFLGLIFMLFIYIICFSSSSSFLCLLPQKEMRTFNLKTCSRHIYGAVVLIVTFLWMFFYFKHELSFDFAQFLEGNSLF